MRSNPIYARLAAGLLLTAAAGAYAQTDAGGLFRPWPQRERNVEATAEAVILDDGDTNRGGDDFQLSLYRTFGRWRLDNSRKLNPTVGYALTHLELNESSPLLPDQLSDVSVGLGSPLYQFRNDWFIAAAAAAGYAGNVPFNDANAWYGRATLVLGKELGEDSNILIGLDYNGNRAVFPDIPLLGFAYTFRVDPQIVAALGLPYSSILWEPTEQLRVEAGYSFPENYNVTVSYEPVKEVRFFLDARNTIMPFWIDGLDGDRRLFFEQQRVEVGVRWQPYDLLGVVAAAGYAFSQDFSVGWDARDMDHVTGVSDEPYLRVGLEWRY